MSLMSDLGMKIGAEFKSHRLRIEQLENDKVTAEDIAAASKVQSVNGKEGNIVLSYSDVGAVSPTNYASSTKGGTIKARLASGVLYITTNGNNA